MITGNKNDDHIINETHPGGSLQQCGFMVGPDGIIYVHKQGDNVTALQDNGSGLRISGKQKFLAALHSAIYVLVRMVQYTRRQVEEL
ncbi:MAG: hypothetical protein MZV64_30660 [Ignavibacteriales bacterium]|nr:hypothetical protein [Ignavibacteriales bacterium]